MVSNYSHTDPATISQNTFYRLKQVDTDGNSKYLGTKLVKAGKSYSQASVYPNPAQGSSITLLAGDQPLPVQYRISDVQGKLVKTGTMRQSQEEVNIQELSKGMYFMQIGEQVIKMQK